MRVALLADSSIIPRRHSKDYDGYHFASSIELHKYASRPHRCRNGNMLTMITQSSKRLGRRRRRRLAGLQTTSRPSEDVLGQRIARQGNYLELVRRRRRLEHAQKALCRPRREAPHSVDGDVARRESGCRASGIARSRQHRYDRFLPFGTTQQARVFRRPWSPDSATSAVAECGHEWTNCRTIPITPRRQDKARRIGHHLSWIVWSVFVVHTFERVDTRRDPLRTEGYQAR